MGEAIQIYWEEVDLPVNAGCRLSDFNASGVLRCLFDSQSLRDALRLRRLLTQSPVTSDSFA